MIFPEGALKINIQFNHKISSHVKYALPSWYGIHVCIFQPVQVTLVGPVRDIASKKINTE